MPRGKKTCSKCNRETGPRTKICECGHHFAFSIKAMRPLRGKTVEDWKQLKEGDVIKCVSGSGPYCEIRNLDGEIEKRYIGYTGIFKVKRLEDNGIHAYPVKAKREGSGHCFISMKENLSPNENGIIHQLHQIEKVKIRR